MCSVCAFPAEFRGWSVRQGNKQGGLLGWYNCSASLRTEWKAKPHLEKTGSWPLLRGFKYRLGNMLGELKSFKSFKKSLQNFKSLKTPALNQAASRSVS